MNESGTIYCQLPGAKRGGSSFGPVKVFIVADMPTIRHKPDGFPSAGPRIRAAAIYKEKLRPRDRVISSYCKYMQLSVCRRRSARLISRDSPVATPAFALYRIRFTYLLIQSNERAGPAFLKKRAQTINIDFIISRLVLTKSYFPVTMTRSSKRDNSLSPLSPPDFFRPHALRDLLFTVHFLHGDILY